MPGMRRWRTWKSWMLQEHGRDLKRRAQEVAQCPGGGFCVRCVLLMVASSVAIEDVF